MTKAFYTDVVGISKTTQKGASRVEIYEKKVERRANKPNRKMSHTLTRYESGEIKVIKDMLLSPRIA